MDNGTGRELAMSDREWEDVIHNALDTIATYYGTTVEHITGLRRKPHLHRIRKLTAYVLRIVTPFTYEELAYYLDRHPKVLQSYVYSVEDDKALYKEARRLEMLVYKGMYKL